MDRRQARRAETVKNAAKDSGAIIEAFGKHGPEIAEESTSEGQTLTPESMASMLAQHGPEKAAEHIHYALLALEMRAIADGIKAAGEVIEPKAADIQKALESNPDKAFARVMEYVHAIVGIEPLKKAPDDLNLPQHGGSGAKVEAIPLDPTKMRPVTWLWHGRIPRGQITMLDGDPGLGKSTVALDLAARVSTGRSMPFATEKAPPANVLILSYEDDPDTTITPRIVAAGGDPARVLTFALKPLQDGRDNDGSLDLGCIAEFEREVSGRAAALLIVDPLSAAYSDKTDTNNDKSTRRDLKPLSKMAQRTGCAVLAIRHLTKASTGNPIYAGQGSIAIIGNARSGLMVKKHPENEDVRLLMQSKSNLGEWAQTIEYEVAGCDVNDKINTAKIEWKGHSDLMAEDIMSEGGNRGTKLEAARTWLEELLSTGPMSATDIRDKCQQAQPGPHSWATVRRAQKMLGVESYEPAPEKGQKTKWYWMLPKAGAG